MYNATQDLEKYDIRTPISSSERHSHSLLYLSLTHTQTQKTWRQDRPTLALRHYLCFLNQRPLRADLNKMNEGMKKTIKHENNGSRSVPFERPVTHMTSPPNGFSVRSSLEKRLRPCSAIASLLRMRSLREGDGEGEGEVDLMILDLLHEVSSVLLIKSHE